MKAKYQQLTLFLKKHLQWSLTIFWVILIVTKAVLNLTKTGEIQWLSDDYIWFIYLLLTWVTDGLSAKGVRLIYQGLVSWGIILICLVGESLYDGSYVDTSTLVILAVLSLIGTIYPLGIGHSYLKRNGFIKQRET